MTGDPKPPPEVGAQAGTDLIVVQGNGDLTVVDEQVAELSEQLAEAKDNASQDRFYFLLVVVIIFNVFAFPYIASTVGILVVALLEIILLIGVADRLGVEQPKVLLSAVLRRILRKVDDAE